MTNINKDKISENARFLGLAPIKCDNTEKRSAIRKLLNGLGFATADYIELTMPVLQSVYNDGLILGIAGDMLVIKNCSVDRAIQAIADFRNVMAIPVDSVQALVPLPPIDIETFVTPKKETKTMTPPTMNEDQAIQALRALLGAQPVTVDESRVLELVKAEVAKIQKPMPTEIVLLPQGDIKNVGLQHSALPELIKILATGINVMLVGPAGSGKTTLAHQCADILGIPFYFNGAISSEYKLTGFIDAHGRIVSTAFRKAYETGGVYLFDEIDASMPDALLAFNAALANGHMDFPDGAVTRHKDFYCIAAANTFGKGADRVYVGRNQLDAASLNRFVPVNVDYDEALERAIANNDNWTNKVQSARRAINEHKIRHVLSPRNSVYAAKLAAAGLSESRIYDLAIWQGLDADSVRKLKGSL